MISNRWQYFRGYTLFLCKECVSELHELPPEYRQKFLFEMSIVSEALYNAFHPVKLNYELLGNGCRPLHWHLIPRYGTDPMPEKAIRNISRDVFDTTVRQIKEMISLRDAVRDELMLLSKKHNIHIE